MKNVLIWRITREEGRSKQKGRLESMQGVVVAIVVLMAVTSVVCMAVVCSVVKKADSGAEKNGPSVKEMLSDEFYKQREETRGMLSEMSGKIDRMADGNERSLAEIKETVSEKLDRTLDERLSRSFESVRTQLKEVYEGLGEMKSLAGEVKDLSNVLGGVKTRGIVGEYQLEAILSEVLAPDQYDVQVQVTPGSKERVDAVVRFPGAEGDGLFLPIDSKFPMDTYGHLADALDNGDRDAIVEARKLLRSAVLGEAKSIRSKYVDPPYTTEFAVMFLPAEGLYAEVVNMGLLSEMQQKYSVNVAGPSTMAAMLTSFRMGFRALAIEKRSGEVWQVLSAVKKEFGTFEEGLKKMKERMNQADAELDALIGTRTRMINRKLKGVSELESLEEAERMLEIEGE